MVKLKIKNLNEFLEIEFPNPFKILNELEQTVKNNKIEYCLLIPYKDEGDVIFDLFSLVLDNKYLDNSDFIDMDFNELDLNNFENVIITYQYSSAVS